MKSSEKKAEIQTKKQTGEESKCEVKLEDKLEIKCESRLDDKLETKCASRWEGTFKSTKSEQEVLDKIISEATRRGLFHD